MAQLIYQEGITSGVSGDIGNLDSGDIQTRFLADGEDTIPLGRAVETDAASGPQNVIRYQGGTLVGVAIRDRSRSSAISGHVAPTELPVMTKGMVWVDVDGDVAEEDDVYVRSIAMPETFNIEWNADFITGNTINGSIGGVAITAVPFNTDQATTLDDLLAEIQGLPSVADASVIDVRTISVTALEPAITLSETATFTVTGGVSQATETYDTPIFPSASADLGVFRADDDNGGEGPTAVRVTRARFVRGAEAGGVALLQINLP